MYIRQCFRIVEGERPAYWALVESERTECGPRQNVVAWLGALDEAGRLGVLQPVRCKAYGTSTYTVGEARPETAHANSRRQNVVETKRAKPNVFIVPSRVVGEVGLDLLPR